MTSFFSYFQQPVKRFQAIRQKSKEKKAIKTRQNWPDKTFIAITGSCGKSSATFFLSKILSDHEETLSTIGSNTCVGIYRTLKQLQASHRYVIQEIAASGKDFSMQESLRVFQPTMGIVLNIGQDHYQYYSSEDAIAKEKGQLIKALPPSGTAILNMDDNRVLAMQELTEARILTFGTTPYADIYCSDAACNWPQLLNLNLHHNNEKVHIQTGLFGTILVPSLLSAATGAIACGLSLEQIKSSLSGIGAFRRRMAIHKTQHECWFIDDAYKAPYWTVDTALSQMKDIHHAPRKTFVLGPFDDVTGATSPKYRATAKKCLEYGDRVLFVGEKAKHVRKIITKETKKQIFAFDTLKEAHTFLEKTTVQDELIYLKSSRRKHLERLVYPSDKLCCWKENCPHNFPCGECEESGLSNIST